MSKNCTVRFKASSTPVGLTVFEVNMIIAGHANGVANKPYREGDHAERMAIFLALRDEMVIQDESVAA